MSLMLFLILTVVLVVPFLRFFVGSAPVYAQMLLIPVLGVMAIQRDPTPWRTSPMRMWFVVMIVAVFISSLFQIVFLGSMMYSIYTLMTHLLPMFLLPALVIILGNRPDMILKFRWYWAILASVAGMWAILQVLDQEMGLGMVARFDDFYYFTIAKINADELIGRKSWNVARGVAGAWNPNSTAMILAISLPVVLGLAGTRRRVLFYSMVFTVFIGIAATGSRQGMLAIPLCLAIFLMPRLSRKISAGASDSRKPALVLLGLVLIGAMAYGAMGVGRAQVGRLTESVVEGIQTRARGYGQFAKYLGSGGVQVVVGKGPDARRVTGRTGNVEAHLDSGFVSNSWLLPILEFGPVGFVAITGLFIVSWRLACERWAHAVLAVLAWIMICDNAVHAVHFGMAIRTLGFSVGPLSAIYVAACQAQQYAWANQMYAQPGPEYYYYQPQLDGRYYG